MKFQVLKARQNITSQLYSAISQTTTAHVYNVAVPSLETVVGREVMWKSTITLKLTNTNKPTDEFLVNYGVTDALAPFPLHHLANTMTATIKNNTVSMNVQEALPILLRLLDPHQLAKSNGMTPTRLDVLGNYTDVHGCLLHLI